MNKRTIWKMTAGLVLLLSVGMPGLTAGAAVMPEEGEIAQGIYLDDTPLGGMTRGEAESTIDLKVAGCQNRLLTVRYETTSPLTGKQDISRTLGDLGLECTNRDLLDGVEKIGHTGSLMARYKELKALEEKPIVYSLTYAWNTQSVLDFLNNESAAFESPSIDATITRMGDQFYVTESTTGWEVNRDSTTAAVLQAFASWDHASDIQTNAVMGVKQPEYSSEMLSRIKDKLGECSTYYGGGDAMGRNINLALGTSLINGSVVLPGETFSANGAMEPYTEERGWQLGASYTADGGVEQTLGGGVCQISSTFYNAALFAEVEIAQRAPHSMSVGYLPLSFDAAIAGDWKDLKITNNYEVPLYIECFAANGELHFAIWGEETRPANRTLSFESETLETWENDTVYQDDPTLPQGKQEVVYNGHTGYRSAAYKCVWIDGALAERTLMHEDTYRASSPIVKVGTGPAETTAAPENGETKPADGNGQPAETTAAVP